MKTLTFLVRQLSLTLAVLLLSVFAVDAQTLTFTYQGKLPDEYNQPTGPFDFQFNLYDESSGSNGPLNATPIVIEDVQVTSGAFTVSLNFGSLFSPGADRYLEIGVRSGDSTEAFTIVSSRPQILSVPYAMRSVSAGTSDIATNAQNLGGTAPANFVQTTDSRLTDARTPTAGSSNYIQNTTSTQSGANFNIDGTGTANVLNATSQYNIGGNRVLGVAGDGNFFAGFDSGRSNTDGNNNSFVGSGSGQTNSTGFRNSFFGSGAGSSTGAGHNNVFLGGSAGGTNTSGSFNVFIGESAFVNNTGFNLGGTSSYNTFVGALSQVTPGNPLFFASAFGARSVVNSNDTIVLGKTAGVYDGISRPADTVLIPGHLQVTGSVTASSFNGSGLTNINASNITTGTLDNARLSVVPISKGGTGLTTPGSNGNLLRSDGTNFTSSALQSTDIPDLGATYIRNQTATAQIGGFNLAGTGTAGVFNAITQFNIGGNRVLSTAGTRNIFVGFGAGTNNTTAIDNAFFGTNAGNANTGGGTNAFFGSSAGFRNTDGNANSFFGGGSGGSNTLGSQNSFFGALSGVTNTSGTLNSFFGTSSGHGNTTGSNNSFFGGDAGFHNTTGFNNSFFGAGTGNQTTTGNNNTLIGANAVFNLGINPSYSTVIGSKAVGTSSDTIVLGKTAGTYDGVSRPADTVQIPGNLNVSGTVSGNGGSIANLNASNITSGTLDNNRLNIIAVNKGGTGLTAAGTNGNFLRSNGTAFTSSPFQVGDVPDLSTLYIRNQTGTTQSGGFNLSGNGTAGGTLAGNVVNATTQFNIGGNRVLSIPGASNTFAGVNAGLNTTGGGNSFFGRNAGQDNTTGISNSFFGNQTGPKNINGTENSFFGAVAGNINTDGSYNSFFGTGAGANNTIGNRNSYVGDSAGISNTTGAENSFVGFRTGFSNTTGNNNSILGANADLGSSTLSYATAIGSHSAVNSSDTVVIGKAAGIYSGLSRPADSVQIPGNLNVSGTIIGNINGSSFNDLNAANITTGTLDNARLGSISTPNIADGAISSVKIADGAVTAAKIGSNQVVKQLNGLTDSVNLAAGANVTITPSGNTLTIASSGGASQWTSSGSNISYNSGSVGVGTASPESLVHLTGPSNFAAITFNTPGNNRFRVQTIPNIPNWGALTLNANYNAGWMLDDTTKNGWFFKLDTRGANGANVSNGLWLWRVPPGSNPHTDETAAFGVSNGLAYIADNLGIGTFTPTSKLHVIGDGKLTGSLSVDGNIQLATLGAGGSGNLCRNASNQIATCSSSLRYKTNIAPFSFGLNVVQRLRPIRFEWKDGGMKDLGFGAEAVAAIEPLLVTYNSNGEVEGVKYDRISAVLVNAVKEQQAQIEAQQLRLTQQQGEIERQQQLLKQQGSLILGLKMLVCSQNPNAALCK